LDDCADSASIASSASRSTIQYQRPFRFQASRSLADFRSMQVRLNRSISSSGALSSASSGVPGVGYLTGKGVKWVGLQILKGIGVVEIARRRWMITRLVSEMDRLDANSWERWLLTKENKVRRAAEDLLELSSDHYKSKYRTKAIDQGSHLRDIVSNSPVSGTAAGTTQDSFVFKLFPLYLLSKYNSASSLTVAGDIREILLQDAEAESDNEGLLYYEFIAQLCHELAYGPTSEWRYLGYATLWRIVRTAFGRQLLENLDYRGDLISDLAKSTFDQPIADVVEQATAVKFFSIYAENVSTFRGQVLSLTGVPLLIHNIENIRNDTNEWLVERLCSSIVESSEFEWCCSTLVGMDICPFLAKVLIDRFEDGTLYTAWTSYSIMLTIRNIALLGGETGAKAARDSFTPQLRKVLPKIKMHIETQLGSAMANTFQESILKVVP